MKRRTSKAIDATEPVVEPLESRVLYSADVLFGGLAAGDSDLPLLTSDLVATGVLQSPASDSFAIDLASPVADNSNVPVAQLQTMPVEEVIDAGKTADRQVVMPVEPPGDSFQKQDAAAVVVPEQSRADDPHFFPAHFVSADHDDGTAQSLSAAVTQIDEIVQPAEPTQILHVTPVDQADLSVLKPDLRLEVVFVDPAVTDQQVLIDALSSSERRAGQLLVVELAANEDGVKQIAELLSQLSGVDAIHLLSHGDEQGLDLGSARLDITSSAQYLMELDAWAASMDTGADILVYGCNLASSTEGRQLLQFIGSFCDCDVAASNDVTGHALLGGDWALEYTQGQIETDVVLSPAVQDAWAGTLTPQDVYVVPGVTDARIIGYYDFETAAQLGRDHAGDDANITFFGGATQTASQSSGQALAISGGQYGDITGITTGGAMTIAGTVRFDATGGGNVYLILGSHLPAVSVIFMLAVILLPRICNLPLSRMVAMSTVLGQQVQLQTVAG